jgi:YD repeat-containing protein
LLEEADGSVTTYAYDASDQLTREWRTGGVTYGAGYDILYSYDGAGNRIFLNESGTLTTSTYDAANQLQSEQTGSAVTTYSYDASGNMQSHTSG